MNVSCDSCKRDFEIKPKKRKVKMDIEKNYFTCPHCKHVYLLNYTDREARALQRRQSEIISIRSAADKTPEIIQEFGENKIKIAAIFEKLKLVYES